MYFCGVQHFFDIEPKINEQLHFELPQVEEKYGTKEYHISLLNVQPKKFDYNHEQAQTLLKFLFQRYHNS